MGHCLISVLDNTEKCLLKQLKCLNIQIDCIFHIFVERCQPEHSKEPIVCT